MNLKSKLDPVIYANMLQMDKICERAITERKNRMDKKDKIQAFIETVLIVIIGTLVFILLLNLPNWIRP